MDAILNLVDLEKTEFNYEKISQKYDFYLINNAGKYKPESRIFDDVLITKNVLAVQYTGGPAFIIMMKHDVSNEENIMKIIKTYNEECDGNLTKQELGIPFEKAAHSMLLVMFYALAKSSKHEEISNLGGKLYYFADKQKSEKQVYCIELKIDKDYIIKLNSVTFTRTDKSYGKPEYVLQKNNTMRRRTEADKDLPFYVIDQFKGQRHETTFLDASDKFYTSKMGVFTKLYDKFNKEYDGLVKLVIKRESSWKKIDVKNNLSLKKEHIRWLKKLLEGKTIRIINTIDDEYSEIAKLLCENLKNKINEIFTSDDYLLKEDTKKNFTIKITDKLGKNDFNIRLIHNQDFFKDDPAGDNHMTTNQMVVQNITLEDFSKDKKMVEPEPSACLVVINELLLKSDLPKNNEAKGQISIFDWKKLEAKNDWIFCYCDSKWNDQRKLYDNHYYLMKIHPDGSFEIGEFCRDLFNQDQFERLERIFSLNNKNTEFHNKSTEKFIGLVINDKDEINIIQNTQLIQYPDWLKVKEAVKERKQIRSKSIRDSYFLGCLDIYYKQTSDELYYSVNQIGAGMNTTVQRAANIRKVIPYENAPIFFENLLETMNVTFVRNGQLTVQPFPFKYLREYEERLCKKGSVFEKLP